MGTLVLLASNVCDSLDGRDLSWEQKMISRLDKALLEKSYDSAFAYLLALSEYHVNVAFASIKSYQVEEVDWENYELSFEFIRLAACLFPNCRAEMTYVGLSNFLSLGIWGSLINREDMYLAAKAILPSSLKEFDSKTETLLFSDVAKLMFSDSPSSFSSGNYASYLKECFDSKSCEPLVNAHVDSYKHTSSSVPVFNLSMAIIPLDVFKLKSLFPELNIGCLSPFYDRVSSLGKYTENELIRKLDIQGF